MNLSLLLPRPQSSSSHLDPNPPPPAWTPILLLQPGPQSSSSRLDPILLLPPGPQSFPNCPKTRLKTYYFVAIQALPLTWLDAGPETIKMLLSKLGAYSGICPGGGGLNFFISMGDSEINRFH